MGPWTLQPPRRGGDGWDAGEIQLTGIVFPQTSWGAGDENAVE